MKTIEHKVRTTVNGETKEVEITSSIFEDVNEAATILMEGGDEGDALLNILNAGIITRDKNTQRAAMRPADPKAEFNRTRNEIIKKLLAGDLDDDEAVAAIREAANIRDNAIA